MLISDTYIPKMKISLLYCTCDMQALLCNSVMQCCDRKSPSGKCAKFCTVAAGNNRVHMPRSLYFCLFAPRIYIVVLRAHPVRGESHNQRNANGEVATTYPPFYTNRTDRTFFVKVSHSTTSTSWSQHHFVDVSQPANMYTQSVNLIHSVL